MSEAFKFAPPEYQKVMMPHLFNLGRKPNKREIVKAIKALGTMPTPEEIEQRIQEAVQQALDKAAYDLKQRELEQKQPLIDAQVRHYIAQAVAQGHRGVLFGDQHRGDRGHQSRLSVAADIMLKSGWLRRS